MLAVQETWAGMEGAVDKGLVRSIGVSNYSSKKMQDWHSRTRIPISVNQVLPLHSPKMLALLAQDVQYEPAIMFRC